LDGYTPGEGEIKIGRLLIIDYDTFHAEFLKRALEPLDVVIKVVLDGEQAVDTARTFHPDIIISELFIPKMDAFRVKEILNQSTKEQGIEFILVSHKKDEESVVRAIDLGITHYLQKPYILPELLGITNSLLVQKHRYAS
jgi:PleD family two-component response regulator